MTLSSADLLSHFAKTTDFKALMELYNRHHDKLIQWIRSRYAVDKSIAENVVIETFEQVRDRCREFDGESFSDWLCTLAGNCVADVAARIERQRRSVALTESWLESLPLIQQKAITILFLYDLPDDIAADVLDVSPDQFRELAESALGAIKREYQRIAA